MSSCTGNCLETCGEQGYWGLHLLSWPVCVLGKRLCVDSGMDPESEESLSSAGGRGGTIDNTGVSSS